MALSEVLFVLLIVACCTGLPALVFYYLLRLIKRIWAAVRPGGEAAPRAARGWNRP